MYSMYTIHNYLSFFFFFFFGMYSTVHMKLWGVDRYRYM